MTDKRVGHTCSDIFFETGNKDYSIAPMVCSCGWTGTLSEWDGHRSGRAVVPAPKPSPWSMRKGEGLTKESHSG